MSIPHSFPSLLENSAQVVLLAGTGLSTPHAPMVKDLMPKLKKAAHSLGILEKIDCSDENDFYKIAQVISDELFKQGKTKLQRDLYLAEAFGIFSERSWFGEIGLPLSGNTPRHRVIARFVVDERFRSIVSLNWDALLEAALESVGLIRKIKKKDDKVHLRRPWNITEYASIVENAHMPLLNEKNVFSVIKPHGCVRELEQAKQGNIEKLIFRVATSELENISCQQQQIFDKAVSVHISSCPLLAVGWSASEKYLRETVSEIASESPIGKANAFTLISLAWSDNHDCIAQGYGTDKEASFFEVHEPPNQPTLDCFFLWSQARYALKKLIDSISDPPQPHHQLLKTRLEQLRYPDGKDIFLKWVDYWLHTWTRLCWRAGVMQGADPQTGCTIKSCEIPLTPRDAYIPLSGISNERHDLQAAAKLLAALDGVLDRFNFSMFPGGLWDSNKLILYLPLPGWQGNLPSIDLVGLKSLVEALRGLGYIRKIYLILLDAGIPLDSMKEKILRSQLEAQVKRLMPLAAFADNHADSAVSWANLEIFQENIDA